MFLVDRLILSAAVPRWTLPARATRLGLQEDAAPAPPAFLELWRSESGNLDYSVSADSTLAGRTVEALHLPDGAIVALVSRDGSLIAPRGSTQLRAGDHLFVIARTSDRGAVNRVLGHDQAWRTTKTVRIVMAAHGTFVDFLGCRVLARLARVSLASAADR